MAPGDKRPNTQARRIPDAPPSRGGPRDAGRRQAELIRRLKAELRAAKEERQQLVEQLQRRNEELHTINEEATAMNEELTTLNGQLQDKVHELRSAREHVAEDLRRMTRLHELTAQLVGPGDVHTMLDNVIRAASDITTADMGHIQRHDETGAPTIAAHTGFDRTSLDLVARADTDPASTCGVAAARRQRVLVEDITASPMLAGQPSVDRRSVELRA